MEGGRVTEGNSLVQPHLCTNYSSPRVFRSSRGWNSPISDNIRGGGRELLPEYGPAVRLHKYECAYASQLQRSNVAVV